MCMMFFVVAVTEIYIYQKCTKEVGGVLNKWLQTLPKPTGTNKQKCKEGHRNSSCKYTHAFFLLLYESYHWVKVMVDAQYFQWNIYKYINNTFTKR